MFVRSWPLSGQPPTLDSVVRDVRVSGFVDDCIKVDEHAVDFEPSTQAFTGRSILNEISDPQKRDFSLALWDYPDPDHAGENEVKLGSSESDKFVVEWVWGVPMSVTGPECVCVGDSAQFEAGGAGGGPYTWSVAYEGTTPVAEIDGDGMLTALAPGIAATVTASAGRAYAVSQEVNVVQIEFLAGGGNVAASELKIAKWNNAFWSSVSTVTNTVLTNGVVQTNIYIVTNFFVKDNFIDLDPDRFCVRITDLSQIGAGSTSMLLGTAGSKPPHNDGATAIDLYATSANSGVFVSTNMILVADDIDDDFSNSVVPADDTRNDRTHKTFPGGRVVVRYPETGQASGRKEIEVPKDGTVHVIPIIMRGRPDSEWGSPLILVSEVEDIMSVARDRFAQIGIDLAWETPEIRNPPAGMVLTNMFVVRDTPSTNVLSADAKRLISEVGTVGDTSDIHIVFLKNLLAGTSELVATSVSDFRYAPSEDGYLFNVFVDSLDVKDVPEYGGYIVAHELGHLLTDEGHIANDKWRLMYAVPGTNGAAGSRRMSDSEETKIGDDPHAHAQ